MKEIPKLEPTKDNLNKKPPKKRKRPIEREITAHSIAPSTEAAQLQKFLSTLETKRGTIFAHGSDNLGEGSAHNREGSSRLFEQRRASELSEEESKDLCTINRLNMFLLQHHARYYEDLQLVLTYRKQFKDNPQQIDQKTKQQAVENWKALSDLANGNLQWDQIQDKSVWKKIRAYKQLTGMDIKIDCLAPENTTELDQVVRKLDWQALEQVVTEAIPSYLADSRISNDERLQNDLIQAVFFIKSIKLLHDFNDNRYNCAIKREIIDFVYKTSQKDVQRVISSAFLSKILDQASQKRVLTLLQPDTLAEHSQARGAELQEGVVSTSTLEQQEGPSSSKQAENLTDPQETRVKKRRRSTREKISLSSLQERKDHGLVWDDAFQKLNAVDQGAASSHQAMKETRQQDCKEKLTQDEIKELVNEVCSIPDFNARKFEPSSKKIRDLVEKLDKTGLDEEQWDCVSSIFEGKDLKSKDKRYRYFYTRKKSVKIKQAENSAKGAEKKKSTYGSIGRYKDVCAQQAGFDNEHDRKNDRARQAGFDNETDRENDRARRRGYSNEYDLKNALAREKGYRDVHDLLNAQSQEKGFANRYQYYKK